MAIVSQTFGLLGQNSVTPRRVQMVVTDSLGVVTSAGYLTPNGVNVNQVLRTDIFDIYYDFDTATGVGTYGEFLPSFSNRSIITLVQVNGSTNGMVNPGSINDLAFYAVTGNAVSGLPTPPASGLLSNDMGELDWTAYTGSGAPVLAQEPTIQSPIIQDTNGNDELTFTTTASAVNYLNITNAATANSPSLSAKGADANISLALKSKGTAPVTFYTSALTNEYTFYTGNSAAVQNIFNFPSTGGPYIYTFPSASGAFLYCGGPLCTPSSGTLTNCVGLPLSTGVTGVLAVIHGGTGVTTSTGTGSVVLSDSPTIDTPNIVGVTDGSNAAAGSVGQFIDSGPLSLASFTTSSVFQPIGSISLTAGDWDIEGYCQIAPSGRTNNTSCGLSLSGSTLTPISSTAQAGFSEAGSSGIGGISMVPIGRLSTASTTTVYLIAQITAISGNAAATGGIIARRVR